MSLFGDLRERFTPPSVKRAAAALEHSRERLDRNVMRAIRLQQELQEMVPGATDKTYRPGYLNVGTEMQGRPSEADRLYAVNSSRYLIHTEGTARWIIRLWTAFGFGTSLGVSVAMRGDEESAPAAQPAQGTNPPVDTTVEVDLSVDAEQVADDRTPQDWANEFLTNRRNRSVLKKRKQYLLSDKLLRDGEEYLIFFIARSGKNAGRCTVRFCYTEQVVEVVSRLEDAGVPLWYKRSWMSDDGEQHEYYYPAADQLQVKRDASMLPSGAKRADQANSGTDVVMLHLAFDEDDNGRGWPLLHRAGPWINQLSASAADLAAITAQNAMFARYAKHTAGSRGTEELKALWGSTLENGDDETNAPPAAGSTAIMNKGIDMGDMPLNRAGSEATQAVSLITREVSNAGGVFPHYLGAGEAFRLATASAMEAPLFEQWSLYRELWQDIFRDIVNIVLDAAERYAHKKWPESERIIDVLSGALWKVDLDQFAEAFESLAPFIPDDRLKAQLVMQALGVNDVDAVLDHYYPQLVGAEAPEVAAPEVAAPEAAEVTARVSAEERADRLLAQAVTAGTLTEAEAAEVKELAKCFLV